MFGGNVSSHVRSRHFSFIRQKEPDRNNSSGFVCLWGMHGANAGTFFFFFFFSWDFWVVRVEGVVMINGPPTTVLWDGKMEECGLRACSVDLSL
jgi:hypothetical protein